MTEEERAIRQAVIDQCLFMNTSGLNQGTSGNISVRYGDVMLITPSATPYEAMTPEMLARMALTGNGEWEGPLKPSTEWRFHFDILKSRPEVGAVVHAHPTFCAAFAIAHKALPAAHYMVAAFGGADVRCAAYARYGTAELSNHALQALTDRWACLLANHGAIVLGETLDKAMWRAVELEALARQYYHALPLGPKLLSEAQIEETLAAFKGYGLRDGDNG